MKQSIGMFSTALSLLFPLAAMAEISKEGATRIVLEEIKHSPEPCVLLPDKTRQEEFGWVFFYTTKKYSETHNINDLVPGMGPIAVEKNGRLTHITTSVDPDRAIKILGDALKSGDPAEIARFHIGESHANQGNMNGKHQGEP